MTLSREVVVPGMLAEYKSFSELVGGLSGEDWETPSRCEGWRVADVAAHVVGQLTDVVNLRLEGLGTPEVTQRQVDERRGKTPSELAAELEVERQGGRRPDFSVRRRRLGSPWTHRCPGNARIWDRGTLVRHLPSCRRHALGDWAYEREGRWAEAVAVAYRPGALGPGLGACRSPLGRLRGVPCVRWRREDCHGRRFRLHPCLHGTWRPCGVRP